MAQDRAITATGSIGLPAPLMATAAFLRRLLRVRLALAGLLTSQLAGVRPNDPLTLAGSVGLLLVAALVACLVPAYRASRVEPIITLRAD